MTSLTSVSGTLVGRKLGHWCWLGVGVHGFISSTTGRPKFQLHLDVYLASIGTSDIPKEGEAQLPNKSGTLGLLKLCLGVRYGLHAARDPHFRQKLNSWFASKVQKWII